MSGGGDDADDIFTELRKKELMEKRLEREILKVDQELAELRKPKPTAIEKAAAEVVEEYLQQVKKKAVDMWVSGLNNPAGTFTPFSYSAAGGSPTGPLSPESLIFPAKIQLELYRTQDPQQKDRFFRTVLPLVSNLPKMAKIVKVQLTRDGKPAIDDSGRPLTKWVPIMESTKPEDANEAKEAREAIKEQMDMDVEVLTFTEGLQRGLVDKRGPKQEAEEPQPEGS